VTEVFQVPFDPNLGMRVTQPAHRPVTPGPQPPAKPRPAATVPALPSWWGKSEYPPPPGSINYGDIQFPLSGAIAPDQYLPLAYGQVRVGGTVIQLSGISGQETYHGWGAVAWCEGEIQSVDKLLVNGAEMTSLTTANAGVRSFTHYNGTGSQYCQDNTSDLFCPYPRTNPGVGSSGPYDVRGLKTAAYTRVDLYFPPSTGWLWWWHLPGGQAQVAAPAFEWAVDVHGLKLYDPRTTLTAYSNNPALIARDILIRSGARTAAQLDDASFIAAANACDSAGFTCNVVFAARTNVKDALAVALQTCNGILITSNGKTGLFLDIVNAGAAAATLSEADGDIWNLNYEWISARDRVTSVTVAFRNRDANYVDDVTPPFVDPGVALGTVPLKAVTFAAPGVNTMAAAVILRNYALNAQAVTFRVTGTMNAKGITLQQGNKVAITTLKGISADFVITQIAGDSQGFFTFVAKPYLAAVYGSTPVSQGPPVTNPPGAADAPPPPAAPRISTLSNGIAFDAPRVYAATGPYGPGDWTIDTGSGDTAKINDGNTTVVAITSNTDMVFRLDRGVVVPVAFGRLNLWLGTSLVDLYLLGSLDVFYSDDNITWYNALHYSAGALSSEHYTTPWQEAANSGVYPSHIEFCDTIGAHRYWKVWLLNPGALTLNLYEASFDTFSAYTGSVVGYALLPWPGYVYNGSAVADMMNYDTPDPAVATLATTATLPTDAAAWGGVTDLVTVVTGNEFTSKTTCVRFAVASLSATRGLGAPGSQLTTVAAAMTVVNDIDGISGSITLVEGANITITDNDPVAGSITIAATGGGWTMENSSTTVNGSAVLFTFSTTVQAGHPIFADGRLMDEAIGDYTRSTNTVTFAVAPISTVKRFFQ
jgi:hypothetical protein